MSKHRLTCGIEFEVTALTLADPRGDALLAGLSALDAAADGPDAQRTRLRGMLALLLQVYAPEAADRAVLADVAALAADIPAMMLTAMGAPLPIDEGVHPSLPAPATGETGCGPGCAPSELTPPGLAHMRPA